MRFTVLAVLLVATPAFASPYFPPGRHDGFSQTQRLSSI